MKTLFRVIPVTLGVCLLSLVRPAGAAEGDDQPAPKIAGTWRWNFTMPDGTTTRPKLLLTVEDGRVAGTTSFRPGTEAPITNAAVNGDELRFQVVRQRDGHDVVTTYSGKWSEKAIKGKIESSWAGENQTFDWEAQRAHVGVDGVWRWTNSLFGGFGGFGGGAPAGGPPGGGGGPGGRGPGGGGRGGRGFETRVELEQDGHKVTGKTVGRFGRPTTVTSGSITNGEVYFEIERTLFETKTVTRYQGKQTGDTIKGTMEFESETDFREGDWEAKRVD